MDDTGNEALLLLRKAHPQVVTKMEGHRGHLDATGLSRGMAVPES